MIPSNTLKAKISSEKLQNSLLVYSRLCISFWLVVLAYYAGTHFGRPDTRIRSGASWLWWQSGEATWHGFLEAGIYVTGTDISTPCASGAPPQALTLSGGTAFITWRLKHPLLGECRRDSRHFWNHRACVGYGPTSDSHNKKAMCHTRTYVESTTNIRTVYLSQQARKIKLGLKISLQVLDRKMTHIKSWLLTCTITFQAPRGYW